MAKDIGLLSLENIKLSADMMTVCKQVKVCCKEEGNKLSSMFSRDRIRIKGLSCIRKIYFRHCGIFPVTRLVKH